MGKKATFVIDEQLIKQVEEIIKKGLFKSMNDFVEYAIKDALEKIGREQLDVYSDDIVEKIEHTNEPEILQKILLELGSTYIEEGCDGLCLECEKISTCEAHKKIMDEWEKLNP
jgi:Arc/MetJ-type ribon-helix-helix transcriptional regulator